MSLCLVELSQELLDRYPKLERRLPITAKCKDLTGSQFLHYHVVGLAGFLGKYSVWLCQCKCGNHFLLRCNGVGRPDRDPSCGCASTHGLPYKQVRAAWNRLFAFCRYPAEVVPEWQSFKVFWDDMGNCPEGQLYLVRLDRDLPYGPTNCVWGNRMDAKISGPSEMYRRITVNGVTKLLSHWADEIGITKERMRQRINKCEELGADPAEAVLTPPGSSMPCTLHRFRKAEQVA